MLNAVIFSTGGNSVTDSIMFHRADFLSTPVKTELDEKRYNSIYVYHKNKWISPQMELALNLLKKYAGIVLGYFQCVPYGEHNHTKGKIYNYQQTTKNNIFSD